MQASSAWIKSFRCCQASAYLWETQRTPHAYLHLELFQLTTEVKKSSEILKSKAEASLETQGQIVGARESLNGPKIWHEEKKKNGEKSPWGQCLTRKVPWDNVLPDQFQTVAAVLPSDWAEKHKRFLAPIRSQNGGNRLELVW